MEKKQKTLAIAGVGIASAAALGLAGAGLANAAGEPLASVASTYGQQLPGGGTAPDGDRDARMRDAGGTLTADAASKAVDAAQAEVDGGTVSGVRATAGGTYVVDVNKSDGTHVHVLLDAKFAVTSVEEGGPGGPGGHGGRPDRDGDDDAPAGGTTPGGSGTGSSDPSDANGTSTTSAPTT